MNTATTTNTAPRIWKPEPLAYKANCLVCTMPFSSERKNKKLCDYCASTLIEWVD